MTPEQMVIDASEAFHRGTNVTFIRHKGVKMPPKFPRGELLCENHDGARAYSYDPLRVLAWLHAYGLVTIEIEKPKKETA